MPLYANHFCCTAEILCSCIFYQIVKMEPEDNILAIGLNKKDLTVFENVIETKFNSVKFSAGKSVEGFQNAMHTGHPGCVFIDSSLPAEESIDFIRQLTGNEMTRDIPVVLVITSRTCNDFRNDALDAGVSAFLYKPVKNAELAALIKTLAFRKSQASRDLQNYQDPDAVQIIAERVKELKCLHNITRLVITPGITVEQLLSDVPAFISAAMQYPEIASVRIPFNEKNYLSPNFRESAVMISAGICKNNYSRDTIEVYYPDDLNKGPGNFFLEEEKDLINTIAGTLGRFLEYLATIEVLGRRDDLLEEIGNIARIGGWEYDVVSGNIKWTKGIVTIHDLKSGSEFEIEKVYNDYTPESRKLFEEFMESSIKSGLPFNLDLELVTRQGRHKSVRVIGKPEEWAGRIVKVKGTVQDISEIKKANQKILESHEYLRATLDSIGDAVIVTDINGIITIINPVAEDITGWKSDEATGKPLDNVFRILTEKTGQAIDLISKVIWKGKDSGIPDNLFMVSKAGAEIPVSVKGTTIMNKEGKATGVVLVLCDRSEEWLNQKIQVIRISLFEYSVSHTLKELLVKIVDEVEELTGSKMGFYHFMPYTREMDSLRAWSTRTSERVNNTETGRDHYNFSDAGTWAECIRTMEPAIHNGLGSLDYGKGLPDGHNWVHRELTVPVVRNNRVVAVIGVGNKPAGYTDHDAEILKYLADNTWEIVEKMRSDEEFRETEAVIRESEEKFRNIFQHHTAVKLLIDAVTGTIHDANEAASRFYGWTVDELKGMKIWQINTLSSEELKGILKTVRNHYGYWRFKHRKADGSVADVQVHSSLINIGEKEYLYSIIYDVTETMKKERQLHLLNRSVEQSPLSLFITDTKGRIEYVNRAYLNWSGYAFDELEGKMLKILKPGNSSDKVYREIWSKLNAGGDWHGEQKSWNKNGEAYWEKIHLSAVKNLEGRIENFMALCEDISRQKQIESDLIEAKEKAEESDRLKSAFLANMSHEIRTPMNGILGFLQLLSKSDISDANREQYISIVTESGNRLMNTINDIIEISKIEVGQFKIVFTAVDLKEVMNYLHAFFKPEAESKGLELKCGYYLPDGMGLIYTDKTKILSVLTNLIKNALKFTKEGFVEFGAGFSGNELCMYVKDSGIGIPGDKLDTVFDRFVQAEMDYSKNYEGSGLGLAIAKSYIESLGGTISVKSEVDKGTVFSVSLDYNPVEPVNNKIEDIAHPVCPCQSGNGHGRF